MRANWPSSGVIARSLGSRPVPGAWRGPWPWLLATSRGTYFRRAWPAPPWRFSGRRSSRRWPRPTGFANRSGRMPVYSTGVAVSPSVTVNPRAANRRCGRRESALTMPPRRKARRRRLARVHLARREQVGHVLLQGQRGQAWLPRRRRRVTRLDDDEAALARGSWALPSRRWARFHLPRSSASNAAPLERRQHRPRRRGR